MIVVTGAAGFIGSCLVQKLNHENFFELVLVDDFSRPKHNKNLEGKKYLSLVERDNFQEWLDKNHEKVEFIFHIGARTDTTEQNLQILEYLNLDFSKRCWSSCVKYNIPFVYASSAATYGLGLEGYDDDETKIHLLKPLNPYGDSKNEFDKWALKQPEKPVFWAGLKFFNVYGPNEFHKGRMASVIFHTYNQISLGNSMKLFQSHRPDIKDGEQKRDFIYVKDVVEVLFFLLTTQKHSGIYNLGSGKARTFLDLATLTFEALDKNPQILFIPTPVDIRENYQYFTEAKMSKLRSIGYTKPFYSLEEGIQDYVQTHLINGFYY